MQQHPIPQNIATYEFRLVGNMTLKQFLELAAGLGLAVLIFNTPLPVYIKWPFIILFALGGVAFAFLPIQERPLDVWVKNFFKSIYSPTQFLWQKQEKLPDFFAFTPRKEKTAPKRKLTAAERAQFAEYLGTLPKRKSMSVFDKEEAEEIKKINQFLEKMTGKTPPAYKQTQTPSQQVSLSPPFSFPSIRIRKLKREEEAKKEKLQRLQATTLPVIEMAQPLNPPLEIGTPFTIQPPKPKAKPAKIIKPKPKPRSKKEIKTVVGSKLPIPNPPELPNIIVGMICDPKGKILPNAIIEIRNKNQTPVRASKTNKLGQFFFATPLSEGEYELEVESDSFNFDIIKFKTEGKIIPPIKIQARGVIPENLKEESST